MNTKRKYKDIICKLCDGKFKTNGFATHITNTHKISIDEYVNKFGEYRPKNLDYNLRSKSKDGKSCLICGDKFASERHLSFHINKFHNISKREYIVNYELNGVVPKCKCGCGEEVTIKERGNNHYSEYKSGHNKSTLGYTFSDKSKKLMSDIRINNLNITKSDTAPELLFIDFLEENDINYKKQVQTEYGCIDFYLPDYNKYVEIDGEYWHPTNSKSLTFMHMSSRISDFRKSTMNDLIRIREFDVPMLQSIEDLIKYNYVYDFTLNYDDIIIEKSFYESYLERKGVEKLQYYMWVVKKFIRTFSPEFPYPKADETLNDVQIYIDNYDFTQSYDESNKEFKGTCYHIGNSYLKSKFKSYWNSKYSKMGKTPLEAFNDDIILSKMLFFGSGCLVNGRSYNLSLKKIISHISQHKYCVSFFKPLLAATIYDNFLKGIETPKVIDPCAGFGGRMVGFKSRFPLGKYIGIEPNEETYSELVELSKSYSGITLHNCTLEEYIKSGKSIECDMTFTSIPYYTTEIYSNHIDYESFEDWKLEFIGNLLKFKNLILNIPQNLKDCFPDEIIEDTYYIKNNTSHFNRSNGNVKRELLLKLK